MLLPSEAEKLILASVPVLPAEDCPLSRALGRVLREPIRADRDMPPFDRVTMDGYAVRIDDDNANNGAAARRAWRVIGLQAAGASPLAIKNADECVEIATGAMLPAGANAIVPYEDTTRDGAQMMLTVSATATSAPAIGQYIHRRASDYPQGSIIVRAGARMSPREIAAAAACGCAVVRVSAQPRIAIITTGDELVEIFEAAPAPHQIRRSNDLALRSALQEADYPDAECFHLCDDAPEIEQRLKRIIAEYDVVLVTGGVSKGKFDYVPDALAKLGVEKKFHSVAQRPGKPLWFGVAAQARASASATVVPVFALPGNPVSTHICFYRYVLPALARMSDAAPAAPLTVALAEPPANPAFVQLTRYVPVVLREDLALAHPVESNTSGDFAALVGTNGFVELPPSPKPCGKGDLVRFYPW